MTSCIPLSINRYQPCRWWFVVRNNHSVLLVLKLAWVAGFRVLPFPATERRPGGLLALGVRGQVRG